MLTRDKNPPSEYLEAAMEVYKKFGISTKNFMEVKQPSDCVYRLEESCVTRDTR